MSSKPAIENVGLDSTPATENATLFSHKIEKNNGSSTSSSTPPMITSRPTSSTSTTTSSTRPTSSLLTTSPMQRTVSIASTTVSTTHPRELTTLNSKKKFPLLSMRSTQTTLIDSSISTHIATTERLTPSIQQDTTIRNSGYMPGHFFKKSHPVKLKPLVDLTSGSSNITIFSLNDRLGPLLVKYQKYITEMFF